MEAKLAENFMQSEECPKCSEKGFIKQKREITGLYVCTIVIGVLGGGLKNWPKKPLISRCSECNSMIAMSC